MIDSSVEKHILESIETAKQDIQNMCDTMIKNNHDPDVGFDMMTTADNANRYELALQEMGLKYAIHKSGFDVTFIVWMRG